MKKIKLSLFVKVLIAIVLGSLLGLVAPDVLVRLFKTFNVLFAQLLKFIVPLLVLGLVTPAIYGLGKGAGKMLLWVVGVAYVSTVCAGLFAYGSASAFFPHILQVGDLQTDAASAKAFEPYIDLKIRPLCDMLTALCLSFMIGICCIYIKGDSLKNWFNEFGEVVKMTIEKAIIPLMPLYIFTMMCEMSASGKVAVVMGTGAKVIATGVVLSILYLVIQYVVAGTIAGKNPFKCLWSMFPAYLIKLATTAVAVALMMGQPISFGLFLNFMLILAVATVASPGVMSGVLMASVGFLESMLGFTPEMTALLMAIYLALDGYGPACNVTGDGAIALGMERFFRK